MLLSGPVEIPWALFLDFTVFTVALKRFVISAIVSVCNWQNLVPFVSKTRKKADF